MAITKLVSPTTPNPTGVGTGSSWDLAMAQLTALKTVMNGQDMLLTQWTNTSTAPKLAIGAYIQHKGAIYIVDTADYTIATPVADGTYYLDIVESGTTLAVSWVASLSGFAWNSALNGLYGAGDHQILPYQLVVSGSVPVFAKWKIVNLYQGSALNLVNYLGTVQSINLGAISGTSLAVTGAMSGASLAVTGAMSGASLAVTGTMSGLTLDTGQGANKLYAMDQNVKTTSYPVFAGLDVHGDQVSTFGFDAVGGTFTYTLTPAIIDDQGFTLYIRVNKTSGTPILTVVNSSDREVFIEALGTDTPYKYLVEGGTRQAFAYNSAVGIYVMKITAIL